MKRKIIILGAGPAGLQAAYCLRHEDYLVLDRGDRVAGFFREFPRSRGLISFNKVHSVYDDPEINLRWDWNSLLTDDHSFRFAHYSRRMYPHADDLVRYLEDFASAHALKIRFGTHIEEVTRDGEGYRVRDRDGNEYACECLVVATGLSKAFVPDIPGIEEVPCSYEGMAWDAERFAGKRVLILGKGNSGFEIADFLLEHASILHLASPNPITFAWNTRFSGNVRANYVRILDAYQLKLLHGGLDCEIRGIVRAGGAWRVHVRYTHADGEDEWLEYDEVIRATGFRFDPSIFAASVPVDLVHRGKLPAMTGAWEARRSRNLFFAGTLTQSNDFRRAGSSFIDGFRYSARTLAHLLRHRVSGVALPFDTLDAHPRVLADALLRRVSTTSALWAQFGYLSDLYVLDRAESVIRHYAELPVDLELADWIPDAHEFLQVTFQWGPWDGDVFAIDRHPKHQTADSNVFLHPIVRWFVDGEFVDPPHHVLEDLFGMYSAEFESGIARSRGGHDIGRYHDEEHVRPLVRFLSGVLLGGAVIDDTERNAT